MAVGFKCGTVLEAGLGGLSVTIPRLLLSCTNTLIPPDS